MVCKVENFLFVLAAICDSILDRCADPVKIGHRVPLLQIWARASAR